MQSPTSSELARTLTIGGHYGSSRSSASGLVSLARCDIAHGEENRLCKSSCLVFRGKQEAQAARLEVLRIEVNAVVTNWQESIAESNRGRRDESSDLHFVQKAKKQKSGRKRMHRVKPFQSPLRILHFLIVTSFPEHNCLPHKNQLNPRACR